MTLNVMIDTMIHDTFVHDDTFRLLVHKMQDCGLINLMSTRIQDAQLSAIPPIRDVGQRVVAQTTQISLTVFVLDASLLDEDRFGTEEANAAFDHLQGGNPKHIDDAMIGATAFNDADILVTNDKRFANRFAAMGSATKVMTEVEFRTFLLTLA